MSGGNVGDALERSGAERDAAESYALDDHYKQNAWKGRDWAAQGDDDQTDLVEAKRQAIRSELSRAGGSDDNIEDYLNNDCDDSDILDNNPDEHRDAFIARSRGKDGRTAAVDSRMRLGAEYDRYNFELVNSWKHNK